MKRGLGKGVNALIPNKVTESLKTDNDLSRTSEKTNEDNKDLIPIKITLIDPNVSQPRKSFDQTSLDELAESVAKVGIIQPILVRNKDGGRYELIAGERRWRAALIAGLKEVPAVIKDCTSKEVLELALIENIQRQDLNPIEEAHAYENLIKEHDLKHEELAERVSKSRAQISNTIRLLKLDKEVQDYLVTGKLSMGHARALLAAKDVGQQQKIAKKIIKNELSVRETEQLVKRLTEEKEKFKEKITDSSIYKEIENELESHLGSKVRIKSNDGKKGKIEIAYSSNDEFERIVETIESVAL